jgi:hypothetical protein
MFSVALSAYDHYSERHSNGIGERIPQVDHRVDTLPMPLTAGRYLSLDPSKSLDRCRAVDVRMRAVRPKRVDFLTPS